jgi:RNA polymerase sigma-70 factor, ECF subfamily
LEGSDTTSRNDVAAAIRGDAEAVRALWQENRRWVAAVILAHKPREADVEDLLQDVAMAFVRMVGKLRDEAMLRPWLRTVAINAARAAGRDARRRRQGMTWKVGAANVGGKVAGSFEDNFGAELVDDRPPDERVDRGEQAGRITDLAARLPDGYREALILKCVRGMSYRQISELMGLPETTIETRIARGRKMLRELAMKELGAMEGGAA